MKKYKRYISIFLYLTQDSDKIIMNTKSALKELQDLMDNHFKIVSNDTKLQDRYHELNQNQPDVKAQCEKFMNGLEKSLKEDTQFIETLIREGEGRQKLQIEMDGECNELNKKDQALMKDEIKTLHEVIVKIKTVFEGQCEPVSNFVRETQTLKETLFKEIMESKCKLMDEVDRYKQLNELRLKTMNLPSYEEHII